MEKAQNKEKKAQREMLLEKRKVQEGQKCI